MVIKKKVHHHLDNGLSFFYEVLKLQSPCCAPVHIKDRAVDICGL